MTLKDAVPRRPVRGGGVAGALGPEFVDLAAGLALALGIERFPMQEWLDSQLAAGRPLSLAELVSACMNVVHPTRS